MDVTSEHYEPFNEAEDNEGFDTETCDTATITTDLWTARSKVGYIGVTCHWLTPDFELVDVLLAIEKMPYPHSNQTILEYLKNKINEFGLEGKLICGITDNGSNMKKAFELWEEVERIPCTAHVLQLTINKALGSIKPYVKRFKKLVKFFTSSPKQTERLNNAQLEISVRGGQQQDLGQNNLIHFQSNDDGNDNAVKTRWNASYNSWVRLLKLRKSIEWLANTLPYEPGKDSKSDARRLKYLLLKNYEWELLEKILSLLKPFEEATTFFSGAQYPTLSLMYPIIQKLKVKFACGEEQDGKEFDISVPNLNNVALNFQRKIYNSLFDYWDKTSDLGLLATILDPLNENSSNLSETSRYSSNFFESIFDNEEHDEISEFKCQLNSYHNH
nr:15351_t:CDS:2 [Entrophospora candida]